MIGGLVVLWAAIRWLTSENEPYRHLEAVTVTGFQKIAQDGSAGAPESSTAYFVGSKVDDVSQIVSAHDLNVEPLMASTPAATGQDALPGQRVHVARSIAAGKWSDGCWLTIRRVHENPYHEEKLTSAQLAGIKDGSVYMLEMIAGCGDG